MTTKTNKLLVGPAPLIFLGMGTGLSFGSMDSLYSTLLTTAELVLGKFGVFLTKLAEITMAVILHDSGAGFVGFIMGIVATLIYKAIKRRREE